MKIQQLFACIALAGMFLVFMAPLANACTAITLKAGDGDIIYGRTMEWGAFDLNSRIMIIPRGQEFTGHTPDGKPGLKWQGKYGVVGIDVLEKNDLADGLNEKGLSVGLLYLPGFAEYQPYEPSKASQSMGPLDVIQYILTTTSTVDEARKAIEGVIVVPVVEEVLGMPAPVHWLVTDRSGKQIVIEYLKGTLHIHDAPLGVMTNSPGYDWHMTNLRNYVNLSATSIPTKKIQDMDFSPIGSGSGMIGLPGDFTPPSRFIRAVAFTQTARPTPDGPETLYEGFRILDNFNVPLGAAEGSEAKKATQGMRSATLWTVLNDLGNLTVSYHTQHNRRVRQVRFEDIDFDSLNKILHIPLDKEKKEDIELLTIPQ